MIEQAREVFRSKQDTLGAEHAETIVAMKVLARAYVKSGNLMEARSLLARALSIQGEIAETWDYQVIDTARRLGAVLFYGGHLIEARSLQEQVFRRCSNIYGPDNYQTLRALLNLGITMHKLREYSQLREIGEELIEAQIHKSEKTDLATIRVLYGLAVCWRSIGQVPHASKLYKRVIRNCIQSRRGWVVLLKAIRDEVIVVPPALLVLRFHPEFSELLQNESAE
jgi:tetratricopeptide (TPR) repeat protein